MSKRSKHAIQMRRRYLVMVYSILAMVFITGICLKITPVRVAAASGDFDLSFGNNGIVITDVMMRDWAQAVQALPGGKILVAGYSETDFALARYDANGNLDQTFGNGGRVTTDFGGSTDTAFSMALQSDNKVVLAGEVFTNGTFNSGLARYNPDGSLDQTFGQNGKVAISLHPAADNIQDIAVNPQDGRIFAAALNNSSNFVVVCFLSNGSLDATFGNGGIATVDLGGIESPTEVAVQTDGKILVAGISDFGIEGGNIGIARFNSNGSLDMSFGSGGKVNGHFGSNETVRSMAVQTDGKIVLGGEHTPGDFFLVRYNANGTLDQSFGAGGVVSSDFFGDADAIEDLVIQQNGKIVAGGVVSINGERYFGLARYQANGTLDTSFGNNGKISSNALPGFCFGLALQSDGKILATGSNVEDFVTIRFQGDNPNAPDYDICIQDDVKKMSLRLNSTTGAYEFLYCAKNTVASGTGVVSKSYPPNACKIQLTGNGINNSVTVLANPCTKAGSANVTLVLPDGTMKTYKLTDPDITNNNNCGGCF
jgi:uncharacterized delta-60 repeat protein